LPAFHLAVWHGFNAPFMMSLVALGGGIALYALRHPLYALHGRLPSIHASIVFERFHNGLAGFSTALVNWLDNASLQRYLMLFFSFPVQ